MRQLPGLKRHALQAPNLVGYTGGANVGPVKSMQLPADLLALLQTHGESRG